MKKFKRQLMRGLAIAIIFAAFALVVLLITLIIINHQAIGSALGSLPGAILKAIISFPKDWLIAGGIGATLAFLACAIFWYWINKPPKNQ